MPLLTESGQRLAETVVWAKSPLAQLRGLIGRTIGDNEALLLPNCPQVHTAFLAYAIDLAFCRIESSQHGRVLYVATISPWHISRFVAGAGIVIEMKSGSGLLQLKSGDSIHWTGK